MSRRPARCTQADLNRAIKAAGPGRTVDVLPDGTIRIAPNPAIFLAKQHCITEGLIVL